MQKENETNKIKNVMLNLFQHPLHLLPANKVKILKKFQDDSMIRTTKAFTLIELLMVVLIIGILATVAVPQYQKAVMKSRYATLKNLVESLAKAEEVYYLANGKYTKNFEELDISMPGGKLDTSTQSRYNYDWGNCKLIVQDITTYMNCNNSQINMTYQVFPIHSPANAGLKMCVISGTDTTSVEARVCKQETNDPTAEGDTYKAWRYQ